MQGVNTAIGRQLTTVLTNLTDEAEITGVVSAIPELQNSIRGSFESLARHVGEIAEELADATVNEHRRSIKRAQEAFVYSMTTLG